MGAGIQPRTEPAVPVREEVTLDEIEKQIAAAGEAAKAEQAKKDAETRVAAETKAREAAGESTEAKALREALRISEESRKRTEDMLRSVNAVPPAKEEEKPAKLTKEQLDELFKTDPVAAITYMNAEALKTIEENISKRIDPLINGGATSAKELARAKYPDEFSLFGPQIEEFISGPRVNKQAMNDPKAWDDLISYIRGQPGNFDKLVDHRATKQRETAAKEAQAREAAAAGAHTRSDIRAPAPVGGTELDATEKEIARAIFSDMEPEEAFSAYKTYRGNR